jgi:hypothetical protein
VKAFSFVLVVLAAMGLASCFTSDQPLLNDDNSVAPYARITFRDRGSNDASLLTRQGKAYVAEDSDNAVTMRFMPLDRPDLYVVEVSGADNGEQRRLFAVVKVDFAAGTAATYKAIAEDSDVATGLRQCEDQMICIDDLKAYIASAEAAIDAGHEPDATYDITVTKGEPEPEPAPAAPTPPAASAPQSQAPTAPASPSTPH